MTELWHKSRYVLTIITFKNQYDEYGKNADLFGGLKKSVEMGFG